MKNPWKRINLFYSGIIIFDEFLLMNFFDKSSAKFLWRIFFAYNLFTISILFILKIEETRLKIVLIMD